MYFILADFVNKLFYYCTVYSKNYSMSVIVLLTVYNKYTQDGKFYPKVKIT